MLTVKDVAKRLTVSDKTVKNWIKNGSLKAYKFGRSYKVDEIDLLEFINKNKIN